MNYKGKNILVTGAAGLVGQTLIKTLLACDANVRATVFKNRKLDIVDPKLSTFFCDLMNYEECIRATKDIDIVFHCAAFIRGAKGQVVNASEITKNNLIPTINIIEASSKNRVERFGFLSSSTVYPDVAYPIKEDEGFVGNPCECYYGVGWMKRYCETYCKYISSISTTKFGIIRATAIYGPHDNINPDECHVIPALILKVINKDNPLEVWGNGNQVRDFIYVQDVVEAFIRCVDLHPNCDPINVATGRATTVKEVLNILLELEAFKPEVILKNNMPSMIPVRLVNTEKAKKVLMWESTVTLENGLSKTIEWVKQKWRSSNVK